MKWFNHDKEVFTFIYIYHFIFVIVFILKPVVNYLKKPDSITITFFY